MGFKKNSFILSAEPYCIEEGSLIHMDSGWGVASTVFISNLRFIIPNLTHADKTI